MGYEIDFIGVKSYEAKQDADAICLRWKIVDDNGNIRYKVGVIDGGFEIHGEKMVEHMNKYYFDDMSNSKAKTEKEIDFLVVTHADQDHTTGLKKVIDSFNVKKIFMNRPWFYIDDLFDKVDDGRITKKSLIKQLREKYKTIADIEDIASENGIPIIEAFQGEIIEKNFIILSPSKQFYLDLIVESQKTPFTESYENQQIRGKIKSNDRSKKEYIFSLIESWKDELLREDVETSAENEMSVVLRGIIDKTGFLLTGDAGIRALTEAMDYMELIGEDIQSTISFYQIPHHGSRHNISPSVLNRMIGEKLKQGESRDKSAIVCVAENSDHPLRMVSNAYIRRGTTLYKTSGNIISHSIGDMPNRGWLTAKNIDFSNQVEEWED